MNWFERPGNMTSKIISTLLRSDVVSYVVTCMYVISRDAIASKNKIPMKNDLLIEIKELQEKCTELEEKS